MFQDIERDHGCEGPWSRRIESATTVAQLHFDSVPAGGIDLGGTRIATADTEAAGTQSRQSTAFSATDLEHVISLERLEVRSEVCVSEETGRGDALRGVPADRLVGLVEVRRLGQHGCSSAHS